MPEDAYLGVRCNAYELELIDRERRMVERRIKSAKSRAVKSLDSFDFKAIPSLNKMMVLDLARCDWIQRRENVIAFGPSGTGKTHVAFGLGLATCQKGMTVSLVTAAALVNKLMEARDEKRLLRLQRQLAKVSLLIIDELGFVPLSKTGAELLFELISQRYERGSTLITSNLPFEEWTETFGTERLTKDGDLVLPVLEEEATFAPLVVFEEPPALPLPEVEPPSLTIEITAGGILIKLDGVTPATRVAEIIRALGVGS